MTTVAATGALKLSWLLIVFPLFGAVVLLVGGRRTDRWGHLLGVAMPAAAFVYGVIAFFSLLGDTQRSQDQHLFSYIPVGRLQVDVSLLIDPLSICFVLLITGVGSLIILYSVGYMAHDTDRRRFFAYLNLFVVGHAAACPGRQLRGPVRRLGGRRPGLLPADRVLAAPATRRRWRPRRPSWSTGSVTPA